MSNRLGLERDVLVDLEERVARRRVSRVVCDGSGVIRRHRSDVGDVVPDDDPVVLTERCACRRSSPRHFGIASAELHTVVIWPAADFAFGPRRRSLEHPRPCADVRAHVRLLRPDRERNRSRQGEAAARHPPRNPLQHRPARRAGPLDLGAASRRVNYAGACTRPGSNHHVIKVAYGIGGGVTEE